MPHVASVTDPVSSDGQTAGLLAEDGQTAFAPVLLDIGSGDLTPELAQQVVDATAPATEAGITVAAGGSVGSTLSTDDSEISEVVGIVAAMIILTLVLGSLVAMGMPIITAVVGLAVALGVVGLLGHAVTIPSSGPTLATMIGLGVGIDYALFLITRHQEHLRDGLSTVDSVAQAVATSGSAIVFAGCTVVIALLSLGVAGIPLVSALGLASAIAVVAAVLVGDHPAARVPRTARPPHRLAVAAGVHASAEQSPRRPVGPLGGRRTPTSGRRHRAVAGGAGAADHPGFSASSSARRTSVRRRRRRPSGRRTT